MTFETSESSPSVESRLGESAIAARGRPTRRLRSLLVSDIRLYREGLAEYLSHHDRLKIVATASSAEAVSEALEHGSVGQECGIDVVLLDWSSRQAQQLSRQIASRSAAPPIVAIGVPEGGDEFVACVEAGIVAAVDNTGSVDELVATAMSAVVGELRCSPKVAGSLVRRLARMAVTTPTLEEPPPLSPRELQVARLLEKGLTNKEIGSRLHIAPATARNHVHSVLQKLEANTRGEAASKIRRLSIAQY